MIPLGDENPTSRTPVVNYALIALNIALFFYEVVLAVNGDLEDFIYSYGLIPSLVVQGQALHTLFSSMFLHGGLLHIGGNMLYLYIFGDNIEDTMGHSRYITFYLLSGLGAAALQLAVNPSSSLPNLGASGAIAGVLGAYLLTYPKARVHTVVFIGFFIQWIRIPAMVLLGFWFVFQLFVGTATFGASGMESGGVAYFAHVGGFVAGMVLINVFKKK